MRNQSVFCGFMRDVWNQSVFCGFMREWNRPVVCGFMPVMCTSLYFVDLCGTYEVILYFTFSVVRITTSHSVFQRDFFFVFAIYNCSWNVTTRWELIIHCRLLLRGKNVRAPLDQRNTPKLVRNMYVWPSGSWFVFLVNTFVLFAVSLKGYLTDDWLLMWPTDDGLVVYYMRFWLY